MVTVKKLVLDVLKPHQPNALDFCCKIAAIEHGYQVVLTVQEVDEETQTLQLEICGAAVELELIEAAITRMGGSLHSIDQVEVVNEKDD